MRGWIAVVPLLAGCDLLFGLGDVKPPPPDADPSTIDADLGMLIDAGECTGSTRKYGRSGPNGEGLFSMCLTPSAGSLDLAGVIHSVDDPRCLVVDQDTTAASKLCVLIAGRINVTADLDTRGSRPIVLLATDSIVIGARVDVAAHLDGTVGSGSSWSGCGSPVHGVTGTAGGGGGAGGSFGTAGGNGGKGFGLTNTAMAKQPGQPDRVRGGCAGGNGGVSAGANPGGAGGDGGGGLYLIAGTTIELTAAAAINASGAAGKGGGDNLLHSGAGAGGGAGGSGGLIGLDAPMIVIDAGAKLMANGGGGGGGGAATVGKDGSDPILTNVTARAPGGAGITDGAAGGAGAALLPAVTGSSSPDDEGSGGGGGGGAGVIRLYTTSMPTMPANLSPAWQIN